MWRTLEEALKKVETEENMTFSRGSSVLGTAFKLQGFEESEKEDFTEEEELAMLGGGCESSQGGGDRGACRRRGPAPER